MSLKVGIIGAGIGGLSIAIRLAMRGYDVSVFEKNVSPGGKISEIRREGFRFDTGPSLLTLPDLLKELFDICGKNLDNELVLKLLPVNCKYYFNDGTIFTFFHDKEKLFREVRSKTFEDVDNIGMRLKKSEEVYKLSAPVFIFSPFGKTSDFNTPPYKKLAKKLYKLDFFRTMNQANEKQFSDYRFVQLFNRYATYNGSNPYRAPATLNMIAHLENNIGAFFPEKGMYSIVNSLQNLAIEKKVKFHFNSKVTKVNTQNGKVTGLVVNGLEQNMDLVVSDVDVKYLAKNLLEKHPLTKRLNRGELSSSALIFYWGIKKEFPELDVHNILFSNDYKSEFHDIFKNKDISSDPTVYIFISSKIVSMDAPTGCENWFVMINSPSNYGQPWTEYVKNTRRNIISKINKTLNTDIEKYISIEQIATPETIERNTMSANGALYGMSSNSVFSAFLRHPNNLNQIKGLYFVGGSVHPGGGIPLCLASAQIVDKEIKKDYE